MLKCLYIHLLYQTLFSKDYEPIVRAPCAFLEVKVFKGQGDKVSGVCRDEVVQALLGRGVLAGVVRMSQIAWGLRHNNPLGQTL